MQSKLNSLHFKHLTYIESTLWQSNIVMENPPMYIYIYRFTDDFLFKTPSFTGDFQLPRSTTRGSRGNCQVSRWASIDILINQGTHVGSHSHSCCSCRLRKRSKANQSPSWRTETSQPNAAGIGRHFLGF